MSSKGTCILDARFVHRRLLQDASADAAVPLKAGGSKKQAVKEQQNARREEPALEQQEREAVALRDLLQALTNEYRPGG